MSDASSIFNDMYDDGGRHQREGEEPTNVNRESKRSKVVELVKGTSQDATSEVTKGADNNNSNVTTVYTKGDPDFATAAECTDNVNTKGGADVVTITATTRQ